MYNERKPQAYANSISRRKPGVLRSYVQANNFIMRGITSHLLQQIKWQYILIPRKNGFSWMPKTTIRGRSCVIDQALFPISTELKTATSLHL